MIGYKLRTIGQLMNRMLLLRNPGLDMQLHVLIERWDINNILWSSRVRSWLKGSHLTVLFLLLYHLMKRWCRKHQLLRWTLRIRDWKMTLVVLLNLWSLTQKWRLSSFSIELRSQIWVYVGASQQGVDKAIVMYFACFEWCNSGPVRIIIIIRSKASE